METYAKDNKVLSYNNKCIKPKASSETWVLNEMTALGRDFVNSFVFNINFISNRANYQNIAVVSSGPIDGELLYNDFSVYYIDGGGEDQAYRTITFLELPAGDLLTWLQSNGIK